MSSAFARLRGAWLDFRDRCLTDPRFHSLSLRVPFTRPVVRARQSELFDLVAGFVWSKTLSAVLETGLLELLRGPGKSIALLAREMGLPDDSTRRLVEAAAALRIAECHGGRYRLGDLGAALLADPGVQDMVRHHDAFYRDLEDPVGLLSRPKAETHLSRMWGYALATDATGATPEGVAPYSALMASSQAMVAREVTAAFPFDDYNDLLDLGGGQGAFAIAMARAHPHLRARVLDLPAVAERARVSVRAAGLSDRIEAVGGSFFEPAKGLRPAGVVSLVRILHDHDDDRLPMILAFARSVTRPGGRLLVAEPMSGTGPSARRITDAYFNLYLHAMGSGRPRKPRAIARFLREAGFQRPRLISTRAPLVASVLVADCPK